jgi:hypothetical protein
MAYSLGTTLGAIAASRGDLPEGLQRFAQEAANTVFKPPFEGNTMSRVQEIAQSLRSTGLSFKVENVSHSNNFTASTAVVNTPTNTHERG